MWATILIISAHSNVRENISMTNIYPQLTQEKLKSIFNYDTESGEFIRRINRGHTKVGEIAGWFDGDGYVVIQINGKNYFAHRLAWLYMTGLWPEHDVDHIDRNPANNAWNNLRPATRSENNCNSKIHKNNKSGIKGVSWDKRLNKWSIQIQFKNKKYGRFAETLEEAKIIADDIRKTLHGDYANDGTE